MLRTKDKSVASKDTMKIGEVDYITQPRTSVATSRKEVVIAPNFTYRRRFY